MADKRFAQSILHHRWDDRIVYLTLVYLDGISTPGEYKELQALLRDDTQKRDLFVSLCIQASQIMELENPNRNSVCPIPDNVEDVTPENQVGIPAPDQISIEICDYNPESVAKQSPWEENVRKETIRQFAEESLETYRKEEKKRQEELAYKAYLARRRQLTVGISSLAALVAIVLFVWLAPVPVSPESEGLPKPVPPQLVATIVKSVKAQWKPCDYPIISEERLFNVPMVLTQGLVQIEFDDGAEVILQAPCEFELKSAGKMFLRRGAVCAKVPQRAHGFTVETFSSSVIDHGTEFGVKVADERLDQQCEIHVFDGMVSVRSHNERQFPLTYLKRGQAAIVKTAGHLTVRQISDSTQRFVQRLFDTDSGLIGWWRFDEDAGHVIRDSSGNGHNGIIVGGAKIVTDPVRGQVLRNVAGGSVDLFNVPNPIPNFAANSSITLAAWVKLKVASTGNYHYVLQLGQNDDYPIASLGLLPDGSLHSYIESDQPGYNYDQVPVTGDVVESGEFAAWHHIAVVYDREIDVATTYIDGMAGPKTDIRLLNDEYAFTWMAAHLGADSNNACQYIGLMDDVAIFNQALTHTEIQAVMAGRVYPVE